jgi:hypothetical protein
MACLGLPEAIEGAADENDDPVAAREAGRMLISFVGKPRRDVTCGIFTADCVRINLLDGCRRMLVNSPCAVEPESAAICADSSTKSTKDSS